MAITPIIPPTTGSVRTQEVLRAKSEQSAAAEPVRDSATQVDNRTLAVAETVRQNQDAARSRLDQVDVEVLDESVAQAALERQSTSAQRAQTNRLPPNILRLLNE